MPVFGDHSLVMFCINVIKPKAEVTYKRDWRHYSKENFCNELRFINWSLDIGDVQGFWNNFEKK